MSDDQEDYSKLHSDRNRKKRKDSIIRFSKRKTIPCILDGKDVVAMSRTGSGKTAAFVIPMLQRLKQRDTKGIRALLVSPTRELALQTFKVVKELGRFTGLRCAILVGGDAIEDQFSTIHENPDILIATPGRLLHVIVEMDLRLGFVQYVVFDEADRLFEMGFQDQLIETLKRIPECRQTLLFSATLPKILVDFAKAGLTDPVLVRLDVDEKISDRLSMVFALCRADEKLSVLLHLCRQMDTENNQTLVFCATMKHVDQLDATARKLNIARFSERKNNILIVTDVAARGVDIPLLDTVINLHFPPKAKLFVHRVGRVARAGRSGTAISLIAPDELPYLTDLFLFLGKPMQFARDDDKYDSKSQTEITENTEKNSVHKYMLDLQKKAANAMMRFTRTRPPPSAESARRVKEELRVKLSECSSHPFLRIAGDSQQYSILNKLANYKSPVTVFELNVGNKSYSAAVMKEKRRQHQERIRQISEITTLKKEILSDKQECNREVAERSNDDQANEAEIVTITAKSFCEKRNYRIRLARSSVFKARHFIAYSSADYESEKHLALDKVDFARQADGAIVEIFADDDKGMYKHNHMKRWDRKKKRFVGSAGDGEDIKRIRTEDGTWLPASYKTGRYEDWKKKQKLGYKKVIVVLYGDEEAVRSSGNKSRRNKWKNHNNRQQGAKSEIRNVGQIRKMRKKSAKLQDYMEHRRLENLKKKAARIGKRKKGSGRKRE
uniref:RNA helicase n=1 Tax=Angiostrongylus cantonensis TaxID=6313 RepID=A0A158P7I1_ANGCA